MDELLDPIRSHRDQLMELSEQIESLRAQLNTDPAASQRNAAA